MLFSIIIGWRDKRTKNNVKESNWKIREEEDLTRG
jgi:hypothetical protein